MKNNVEGECPNCGSENIEYGYSEIDDDGVGYEYECNDCGHHDTEWFDIVYDEDGCECDDDGECYDLVFATHSSCA